MSILTASNLGKAYGADDVFSGLSFSLARGDKVALVGANGCGKTTLLRIMAGLDEPSAGSVQMARGTRVGYLAQTAEESSDLTLWDEMQSSFAEIHALAGQMAELEREMTARDDIALLDKYGALQHEFEHLGGYETDAKIRRVLTGLGFKKSDEGTPVSHLSGGQRVRAALAQLLLQSPDVLLLDEPTNHLDTLGIEWLENYLQEWEGTVFAVSHDRYFLDEVCDYVWEMGPRRDGLSHIEMYRGGYTDYVAQRAERRERAQKEFEEQREFIAKTEEYIRRNMAGQLVNQAKGRLKRLNRLERLEKPIEQRAMALRLNAGPRSGNIVLETKDLRVGYKNENSETTLFTAPNFQLLRTERAALIGPNGTGKTTFLKTILGDVAPLSGDVRIGAAVKIGYFAQTHEGLDLDKTVLDELLDARPGLTVPEARNILGRFLFSGDDAYKKIEVLSGGERGRVALAKLTLQGSNFLLLDEPTNHLDIPSQEILTEALQHFDGTLLLVSHDRYLVAALATQLWLLDRGEDHKTRMTTFRGAYDAWLEEKDKGERGERVEGADKKTEDGRRKTEPAPAPATSNQPPAPSKNRERERLKKLEAIEARIAELDRKMSELSWEMQVAGSDFEKTKSLADQYAITEKDLERAWTELSDS